jgi:O-antigen/teichoic acid export membrane protein
MLQGRLHSFFVSFLFNPAMFAVYSVGCFKLPLLNIITASVGNVMTPAISRFQKNGDRVAIMRTWNNAIRRMNLILLPTFSFFLIMADDFIVLLFTRSYAESVPIFRVALLSILVSALNTGAVLQAYAQTRYIMKVAFLRLPVTFGILYWFTHQWGVLGAVAANVSALILFRLIMLLKVKSLLDCTLFNVIDWRVNGQILLISLLAGLPLLLLNLSIQTPSIFTLGIGCVAYPLFYISTGLISGIIKPEEKEALVGYIRSKIRSIRVYCESFCSGKV